jgi:hypothetical protein
MYANSHRYTNIFCAQAKLKQIYSVHVLSTVHNRCLPFCPGCGQEGERTYIEAITKTARSVVLGAEAVSMLPFCCSP